VWAATRSEIAERHGLDPEQVLRFDANVPPLPRPLPVPAREALAARARYPEGSYRELREAAAAYAGCAPQEIVVDAGADGLIALVARTFLGPGRRALVRKPTYPLYAIASRIEGADVVAEGDAEVVWICNPDNPSGELQPAEQIVTLALALPDSIVAVDEAYYEYCGDTVAGGAPNIVCIRTLSKAFGLAGLRVGYAVTSAEVATELSARRSPAPIGNAAALIGAAALRKRPDVRGTIAERERVRARFLAAGYDAPEVTANFVVVRTPDALARATELERQGLVVRAYPDLLRITVRTRADDDRLLAALGL
jgi:histidinol-phosphate aminotransferase